MSGDVTRRVLLGGVGASVAALVIGPWGEVDGSPMPGQAAAPSDAFGRAAHQPATVHVLGGTQPTTETTRVIRQLSDDVFERLRRVFVGRTVRVTQAQRVGDIQDGVMMTQQWNTGALMPLHVLDITPAHVALFRRRTDWWWNSPLCRALETHLELGVNWLDLPPPAPGATLAAHAFAGTAHVGQLFLPAGGLWTAHYLDEASGVLMRVVAMYDINTDQALLRYDVLCG